VKQANSLNASQMRETLNRLPNKLRAVSYKLEMELTLSKKIKHSLANLPNTPTQSGPILLERKNFEITYEQTKIA
jgi:small-conductance mechanosensitive channel